MDGTFKMSPKIFSQLYVIRAKLSTSAVTCCYALLPDKTEQSYKEMLKALLEKSADLGYPLDPVNIHLDFELPVISAVKLVFGSHINFIGCFYHLTQSTWRKVQELGLVRHYDSEDFKHFCGMLEGLAFVPTGEVKQGIDYLKEVCPEYAGSGLVDYFDSTYVSGHYRAISKPATSDGSLPQIRFRRIPPRFPPELWNVHDCTINDIDRTNNFCESRNNGFACSVGHNHPSLWRLITHLKEDEALVRMEILQTARGQPPSKRQRKGSKILQEKLKALCMDHLNDQKSLVEFLQAIGHCIRIHK